MDDAQLQTVWQQRRSQDRTVHLGYPLALLMKYNLSKRAKQLGKLASVWDEVLPESLSDHTSLESFNSGVLTVLVDSASRRFQLQTLLTGGLKREIQRRTPVAINKIRLVAGQFRTVDAAGASGIVLIGSCVDPYSHEAVRATMGSIFNVPLVRSSLPDGLSWVRRWRGDIVGAHLRASADFRSVAYRQPTLLLVGSEGPGLSPELSASCTRLVRIPMAKVVIRHPLYFSTSRIP